MVLGRNLEQAGESLVVLVDSGSDALGDLGVVSAGFADTLPAHVVWYHIVCTYVLVDQDNSNILPLPSELVECLLDGRLFGFGVDDQVVLLRVRCVGHMLCMLSAKVASIWKDLWHVRLHRPARCRSLSPIVCQQEIRRFAGTSVRKPHLQSPPGTVGPCMLIEVTPWLLYVECGGVCLTGGAVAAPDQTIFP